MPPGCPVGFIRRENLLTAEEVKRLVRVFVSLGVEKVRLTGGEPLMRRDFWDVFNGISRLPVKLNLTTNGVMLRDFLPGLRGRLHHLNVSLDTLSPKRYARITGGSRRDFYRVLDAINTALEMDFPLVKINTVVIRGFNEDELLNFVEFARDRRVAVRFIEFMPFPGNGWGADKVVPVGEMKEVIGRFYPLKPVRGFSEVSRDYTIPGFKGLVGFIGSLTQPFCDTCNRLRLTADGCLKLCLLSPVEVNLRRMLRDGADDDEIREAIKRAVFFKPKGAENTVRNAERNRRMVAIGG